MMWLHVIIRYLMSVSVNGTLSWHTLVDVLSIKYNCYRARNIIFVMLYEYL